MYSQKIRFLSLFLVVSFLLVGCAKEVEDEVSAKTGKGGLIQAADGKSYSVECLKGSGPSQMSSCEVNTEQLNGRGVTTYTYTDTYYYWNLEAFPETDFCQSLWSLSSCYSYFGYKPEPAKPKFKYNNCWSYYLFDWDFNTVPYYCYWKFNAYNPTPSQPTQTSQSDIRLRLTITPITGVSSVSFRKLIFVDGYGRVVHRLCSLTNSTSCVTTILDYLDETERYEIELLIARSRYGSIVTETIQTGTVNCLAMPNQTRDYAADNNAVLLRKGDSPCAPNTIRYNNSESAKTLVQKLDAWAAL